MESLVFIFYPGQVLDHFLLNILIELFFLLPSLFLFLSLLVLLEIYKILLELPVEFAIYFRGLSVKSERFLRGCLARRVSWGLFVVFLTLSYQL